MHNIKTLEKCFKKYLRNLEAWAPENLIHVDLDLLREFNLLHVHNQIPVDTALTRYFQVLETPDKITLINNDFVVWIVPDKLKDKAITYALIATNSDKEPKLEVGFFVSGVYNTSHLVLTVLEKFLHEIQENEELLAKLR